MPGKQSTKSYVISLIDTCTHRTWICARGEQKENDCSQEYLIGVQGDDLSSDAEAKGLLVNLSTLSHSTETTFSKHIKVTYSSCKNV